MSLTSLNPAPSAPTDSVFVPTCHSSIYIPDSPQTLAETDSNTHSIESYERADASLGTEPSKRRCLPPKPTNTRYQTLDAVRGMACLMLVLYHTTFYADRSWSTGDPSTWTAAGLAINLLGRMWVGVPIFFVVSGYCIAASIDSIRRKPFSISNYFYRRFRRIYPPFWAALGFGMAFTMLVGLNPFMANTCLQLPNLASFSWVDWIANVTATVSWMPALLGSSRDYVLLNTWTLCYEEQFYAVAGLLLIFASRYFFQACYWIAISIVVAKPVCRFFGLGIEGLFFDGHWLLFVAGVLLYEKSNYMKGRSAWLALAALSVGIVYGVGEYLMAGNDTDRHLAEYIVVASAWALFLSSVKQWDRQIASHWCLRPFVWLGFLSYSIYLVHFPLTVLIASVMAKLGWHSDFSVLIGTVPLCVIASMLAGWLFHSSVECHFINSPQKCVS